MNAVELINVNKTIKKTTVFDSFSFKLEENKTAVFLSSNYKKLDTLARIVSLVLKMDSGTIKYFDKEVDVKHSIYNIVNFMPLKDGFSEHLTVFENLRLMARTRDYNEVDAIKKINEYGEKYNIKSRFDDKTKTLSVSLKKLVSFLMCIITDAKVLVLDNPFRGVDDNTKKDLFKYIKELKENKTIIILTDLEEAKELADDVYVLDEKEGL